jgi:GNAT superfamily N-acetyltransferase
MSTSPDPADRTGSPRIRAVGYGDPVAVSLVELKRIYVEPAHRRRGLARRLLHALEESAARAGHRRMVLNTGGRQPEALALYARAGYTPVPGFGVYARSSGAVFLGRELAELVEEEDGEWAS